MAEVTLEVLSLRDYGLMPRVTYLKDVYFKAVMALPERIGGLLWLKGILT